MTNTSIAVINGPLNIETRNGVPSAMFNATQSQTRINLDTIPTISAEFAAVRVSFTMGEQVDPYVDIAVFQRVGYRDFLLIRLVHAISIFNLLCCFLWRFLCCLLFLITMDVRYFEVGRQTPIYSYSIVG